MGREDLCQPRLTYPQDGDETYHDYALDATEGFTFEGPFYLNGYAENRDS